MSIYSTTYKNQPSVLNLAVTALVILVTAVYGIIALNTEDALWFWPTFAETPRSIVIHCYGQDVTVAPGTAHFEALTLLVNDGLSGRKNWDGLSMSDDTYLAYQTSPQMLALEMTYAPPVRVHSIYKYFSSVDTMVIPLVGRHAQTNPVFGRVRDVMTAGSLHLETTAPMLDYVQSQGLCAKP